MLQQYRKLCLNPEYLYIGNCGGAGAWEATMDDMVGSLRNAYLPLLSDITVKDLTGQATRSRLALKTPCASKFNQPPPFHFIYIFQ